MTAYIRKPDPVAAIRWTGRNFPEVEQFVRDWIGPDYDTGVRNEPDEGWPDERFAYNIVQFELVYDNSTEDVEIDPGRWIVVHTHFPVGHRERVEVLSDDDFQIHYQLVNGSEASR